MKGKSYRAESGRQAKADGHSSEHILCDILSKKTGHMHTVDGGTRTKRDILCEELEKYYSIKSPSNKNTQVHLTPTKVWCEYFNIQGDLRKWFDMFFGLPNTGRSGRKGASEIPSHLNTLALNWFNDNKMEIFNVIVVKGAFKSNNKIEAGKSINQVIYLWTSSLRMFYVMKKVMGLLISQLMVEQALIMKIGLESLLIHYLLALMIIKLLIIMVALKTPALL